MTTPHVMMFVEYVVAENCRNALLRDGEVTFEKELSYSSSYFQVRNLGTLVTSVTVTTV